MKILLPFLAIILCFTASAQKAKTISLNCGLTHLRLPVDTTTSTNHYTLSITDQSACEGAIPYQVMTSPVPGVNERTKVYTNAFPVQAHVFTESKDLMANLQTKGTPFTHFEINTFDMQYVNQRTVNAKNGMQQTTPEYYLVLEFKVLVNLKATRLGDMKRVILDTNSNAMGVRSMRFPMDFIKTSSAQQEILMNGYPSEAALVAAWNKYKKTVLVQWRDKYVSDFLSPLLFAYKQKYIQYPEYLDLDVYSDKNKGGGYEKTVEAAELFKATVLEIDQDYKNGSRAKFWKLDYQKRFDQCLAIWKEILDESNFDVTVKDNLMGADDRQKILLNYIQCLILSGEFTEANNLINSNVKKELKASTIFDLRKLERLSKQLEGEFNANATFRGWVK